ncbi:putative membrane protein YphA (DoxX/SURF4 family) [Mucilaginibacter frigoritolerans]|jgi:putative oxidoreductase|uniref:Putative membrane protein YphA (DoxX/SURF4 family) n=1 Tax=Mucilaginibacter frigoritolerans TaxID=652788 RepID=A0A562U7N1_9SPHI|nr:DoxX family protein [Mucilaginibacter frigoritolerans]TWJ01589.1 putative membrane protein YphA (DoxX/SURF4 family) [Mucilaginibacter frigoritolerans]
MNVVHKIENWGDTHHPMVLDIIRIALGIFLMLKGFAFLDNSTYLKDMIEDQSVVYIPTALLMTAVYYVIFAHLVGGVLIAMGTLTRFACIIQIPIVIAAVFMTDFFTSAINTMAWPSITALILLVIFTVIGSGPLSLDRYLSKWEVV